MFEGITSFFKRIVKNEQSLEESSKDTAKERLHLVLMQDRANVSADFLELMKQEIIEVIKKYIDVDEEAIDVRLTNQPNEDGTNGAPALYANIPIVNIKNNVNSDSEGKEYDYNSEDTKIVVDFPEQEGKLEEYEESAEESSNDENIEENAETEEIENTEEDNEKNN